MRTGEAQTAGLVKAGACSPRTDASVAPPLKALPTCSVSKTKELKEKEGSKFQPLTQTIVPSVASKAAHRR